jgi:hypothetical protein
MCIFFLSSSFFLKKLKLDCLLSYCLCFQIARGKYHGLIDIGLAVITYKAGGCRIDIDAEEQVYHVKVESTKHFISSQCHFSGEIC